MIIFMVFDDEMSHMKCHFGQRFGSLGHGFVLSTLFIILNSCFMCVVLDKNNTAFYVPPQKVEGYYVIPSELLSVCPSVCPSVRPSAVEHSCPGHNFDTVGDNFMKLGTNINHDQTTCRD